MLFKNSFWACELDVDNRWYDLLIAEDDQGANIMKYEQLRFKEAQNSLFFIV